MNELFSQGTETTDSEAVFLLDSYGLIFRAYFALVTHPLTNKDGKNIKNMTYYTPEAMRARSAARGTQRPTATNNSWEFDAEPPSFLPDFMRTPTSQTVGPVITPTTASPTPPRNTTQQQTRRRQVPPSVASKIPGYETLDDDIDNYPSDSTPDDEVDEQEPIETLDENEPVEQIDENEQPLEEIPAEEQQPKQYTQDASDPNRITRPTDEVQDEENDAQDSRDSDGLFVRVRVCAGARG